MYRNCSSVKTVRWCNTVTHREPARQPHHILHNCIAVIVRFCAFQLWLVWKCLQFSLSGLQLHTESRSGGNSAVSCLVLHTHTRARAPQQKDSGTLCFVCVCCRMQTRWSTPMFSSRPPLTRFGHTSSPSTPACDPNSFPTGRVDRSPLPHCH